MAVPPVTSTVTIQACGSCWTRLPNSGGRGRLGSGVERVMEILHGPTPSSSAGDVPVSVSSAVEWRTNIIMWNFSSANSGINVFYATVKNGLLL